MIKLPVLAIETSSPVMSVALGVNKHGILEKTVYGFSTHSENLLPTIDALLKKTKLSITDIKTFLIGRGPGSFTGLRVGYGTLKGLLIPQKRLCYGALSLDLIAENPPLEEKQKLCVALDARREKIFWRLYEIKKNQLNPMGKPQITAAADWLTALPIGCALTGDALGKYRTALDSVSDKNLICLEEAFWYPRASQMIQMARRNPEKLQKLSSPKDFLPLYFRLSEAEERRSENKNKLAQAQC